jgi:NSS family neurotransmitter:Na+ symporter
VGALFFLALVFGGLTSAISLLEVVVATVMDGLGFERIRAAWVFGLLIALLGVPAALSLDVLGLMDQIAGTLFLILGGFAMALFVGFVMPDPLDEAARGARGLRWFFLWRGLLRWVVPAVLGLVLVFACMDTWKAIFDVVESMQGAD